MRLCVSVQRHQAPVLHCTREHASHPRGQRVAQGKVYFNFFPRCECVLDALLGGIVFRQCAIVNDLRLFVRAAKQHAGGRLARPATARSEQHHGQLALCGLLQQGPAVRGICDARRGSVHRFAETRARSFPGGVLGEEFPRGINVDYVAIQFEVLIY